MAFLDFMTEGGFAAIPLQQQQRKEYSETPKFRHLRGRAAAFGMRGLWGH